MQVSVGIVVLSHFRRFSPGSVNFSHALDPEYNKRRMVTVSAKLYSSFPELFPQGKAATIPGVAQCQVLGAGQVPPGHYGLPDDLVIARQDHTAVHKTPLSAEELAAGCTRLMQLRESTPFRDSTQST